MKSSKLKLFLILLFFVFFNSFVLAGNWPLRDSAGNEVGVITDIYASGRDMDGDDKMDEFQKE